MSCYPNRKRAKSVSGYSSPTLERPTAETCIAYCRPGEEQADDERIEYEGFPAWIDDRSQPFLVDALVDYAEDRMGGQLTIKAPNSKVPNVSEDSPMEDRINYVLHSEINPGLGVPRRDGKPCRGG